MTIRTGRITRHFNHLWFRLTLTFGVVVFLGVIATYMISLVIAFLSNDEVDLVEAFSVEGGPVDTLAQYYQQVGSWDDITSVMEAIQSNYPPNERASITFAFIDEHGTTLFDAHLPEDDVTTQFNGPYYDATIPITVDELAVGQFQVKAYYAENVIEVNNVPDLFTKWIGEVWWQIMAVGIFVGLLSGVVVSYSLAKPLRRLADTAEDIGQRDLSSRVDVRGSTEVNRLAESFNNMATQLETAERLRRKLVADVAHELRTPLTVLQGNLRAILDDVYPLSKSEVASLYNQTRVLNRLVNDLHELSQAEAKKLPLSKEELGIGRLLRAMIATFEPIVEEAGMRLSLEVRGELLVHADSARISQVIHNLLANALHHTPLGGQITIRASRDRHNVHIDVADTGSGIAPEHLPYVFDRFYRVEQSRSRNQGGAGLGLAISKAIVEAHNGAMSVYSTGVSGEGSTFTVVLPAIKKSIEDIRLSTQELRNVKNVI